MLLLGSGLAYPVEFVSYSFARPSPNDCLVRIPAEDSRRHEGLFRIAMVDLAESKVIQERNLEAVPQVDFWSNPNYGLHVQ
jgi:hypothetical protein